MACQRCGNNISATENIVQRLLPENLPSFVNHGRMSSKPPSATPQARRHDRTAVNIDVTVVGVLESFEATLADLSEGGAMVTGGSLPERARCEIHCAGQVVYGLVMWSEVDRMGIRFPYEMRDGPLHQLLVVARSHGQPRTMAVAPRPMAGFGRRGL
jgi:hypothetical protein